MRLSARFARYDDRVNALHDALNRRFSALWWPLEPPATDRALGSREHALYAAHVTLALVAVSAVSRRRGPAAVALLAAGFGSWVLFTGAWDRRAVYDDGESA
jgi:hypothetical protein